MEDLAWILISPLTISQKSDLGSEEQTKTGFIFFVMFVSVPDHEERKKKKRS